MATIFSPHSLSPSKFKASSSKILSSSPSIPPKLNSLFCIKPFTSTHKKHQPLSLKLSLPKCTSWLTQAQQGLAALAISLALNFSPLLHSDNALASEFVKGKKAIGCRWVFKVKYDAAGEIDRFKARLVAKGYSQQEGIDYFETFSPVVKMVTVRLVLTLAVMNGWGLFQMDVYNAFLQGDLNEEVYMQIPQGFGKVENDKVCKLTKSLYGLKQASRQWNAKLTEALLQGGFKQNKYDYSLFVRQNDSEITMVLAYVDDLVVTGNNLSKIDEVKDFLHSKFKIKDLGKLKYFLGLEVARSPKGIVLYQRKYALDLISDMGLSAAKPLSIPMEQSTRLSNHPKNEKDDPLLLDATMYRRLVGRLSYLTTTRPDICFAVQSLSQFMSTPRRSYDSSDKSS